MAYEAQRRQSSADWVKAIGRRAEMGQAMLRSLSEEQREKLATRWIDRVVESFPEGSHEFLRAQTDRFRNPIGHALRTELPAVLSHIIDDTPVSAIQDSLGRLTRILAVQDWNPPEALAFVFSLKTVIRGTLTESSDGLDVAGDIAVLDERIDRLALAAFGEYVACRERLSDIRVQSERRRVSKLLERLGEPLCES